MKTIMLEAKSPCQIHWDFKTLKEGKEWSPNIVMMGDMGISNARSLPILQEDTIQGVHDLIIHVGDFAYDMHEVRLKEMHLHI